MASIVIAGDTSGSVTLQAPAVAGSTVLNLPATSGTIQTSGAGYTTNGVAYATSTSSLSTGSALTFDGSKLGVSGSGNTLLINGSGISANFARFTSTGGDGVLGLESSTTGSICTGSSAYATLLYTVGATPLQLGTNSNVRATLDTAGNLGLGVTPSAWGGVYKAFQVNGSGSIWANTGAFGYGYNGYYNGSNWIYSTTAAASLFQTYGGGHYWYNAPSGTAGNAITFTQAMTLDASGNLLVNTTGLDGRFRIQESGLVWARVTNHGYAGTQFFDSFRYNGTEIGKIQGNNSNVSYLTSSDYRLKENIAPMTGALATVAQLKPCTYTWKVDGASGQGFIAHELQEVVPDCVSGEKDAVNEDGSIKPQGIDTSFLVATLTAALQEQQALINTLTDRISVLENK